MKSFFGKFAPCIQRKQSRRNLFEMPDVRLAMPECSVLDVEPGTVRDTVHTSIPYHQITGLRFAVQALSLESLIEKHGEGLFFWNLADVVATIGARISNTEEQNRNRKKINQQGYLSGRGRNYFLYHDGQTVWAISVHGPERPGFFDAPYLDWYDRVRKGCWYVEVSEVKKVEFTSHVRIHRPRKEIGKEQVASTK